MLCALVLLSVSLAPGIPQQPVGNSSKERGQASYYHHRFHGRRMSSGVHYHRDSLYCAHRRHPFGTLLKVTNVANGKSVVVKVADRGPFHSRRIIDLSFAAAKDIDMVRMGVATVEIEVYHGDTVEADIVPVDSIASDTIR
ncbi:MAG: septal ring lytic transglycosylase RlpA family protein [Prevotella sp.]|nr:septal ring lytic transglycosylase RlpA family protein [Prevotella sp.]